MSHRSHPYHPITEIALMLENLKVEQAVDNTTQLVSGIIVDAQKLVRQEFELAKLEFKQEWTTAKAALLAFGTASSLRTIASLHLSLAVVFFLTEVLGWKLWLSFLATTLVSGCIALMLYRRARNKLDEVNLIPRHMAQSVKENVEWMKKQM